LAEHSRNLAADPRASLLVTEAGSVGPRRGDPLERGRATLVGRITEPPDAERSAALELYRAAHGGALGTDHGFRIYRLDVTAVRYVGGFARMSWVAADGYAAAEPDPLLPHVARIVEHMNDDHAGALVEICRTFGDRPAATAATMTGTDRYGFVVQVVDAPDAGATDVRIPYPRRCDTPDEVRAAMVELVRTARSGSA
nr:DUF2470 domain-containing protein [Actinomycetota bacterium]